jgi:hypothetical protein
MAVVWSVSPGAATPALVNALRQRAHFRHARIDLLTQQHAATAWLCSLTDDHFNGISAAQVIGIEAIARRQALIH